MTVKAVLDLARRQWVVVSVAVLCGALGALLALTLRAPSYTATTQMYVTAQVGSGAQAAYQGAQLSEQRVKSYTELVIDVRVTGEVATRLGLPETPEQLADKITATSASDSVLIDVSVSDPSPERAALIANEVGTVFPSVVAGLEQPLTPNAATPVAVKVVDPADVPTVASSPGARTVVPVGVLAGLALGLGVAFLRTRLDTSVRSRETLQEITGVPSLAAIMADRKAAERTLIMRADPTSPRAEAFRQLRTNLQFTSLDKRLQVIVVTSSTPGEGKSYTTSNLALALASAGHRILVVDADLRRPTMDAVFGLERGVGLTSILSGDLDFASAVQKGADGSIDVVCSGPLPPNPSELLSSQAMNELLEDLRHHYDTILLDSPPVLPVTDAVEVAVHADGVLLMCRHGRTTTSQITTALDSLRAVSARVLGTVLTMAPSSGVDAYSSYTSYGPSHSTSAPLSPPLGMRSAAPPSTDRPTRAVSGGGARRSAADAPASRR